MFDNWTDDQFAAWLAGFFDGEGCIYLGNKKATSDDGDLSGDDRRRWRVVDLFALGGVTDNDLGAGEFLRVEGVHGLAVFEHHVVADIDDVVDRADAVGADGADGADDAADAGFDDGDGSVGVGGVRGRVTVTQYGAESGGRAPGGKQR